MALSRQIDLGPGGIVLYGSGYPAPPKEHSPQFSAHVCWRNGWIKMPLGMEVGSGLGDIV